MELKQLMQDIKSNITQSSDRVLEQIEELKNQMLETENINVDDFCEFRKVAYKLLNDRSQKMIRELNSISGALNSKRAMGIPPSRSNNLIIKNKRRLLILNGQELRLPIGYELKLSTLREGRFVDTILKLELMIDGDIEIID